MRGPVDVVEVDGTVDGGEEGAVEPSAPLRDQLWHLGRVSRPPKGRVLAAYLVGYIGDSVGGFDIVEDPRGAAF